MLRLRNATIYCTIFALLCIDLVRSYDFPFLRAGERNDGTCELPSDCKTDKAVCKYGICECPLSDIQLTVKDRNTGRSFAACTEMIYSLYDGCKFDEQCSILVDPLSVCKTVCVCAPSAKDQKGKCISLSELDSNRRKKIYRISFIVIPWIIILIVAVSLWTLRKRCCHKQNPDNQQISIIQNDALSENRTSIELLNINRRE
ncbi:hypothetical protein HNY73_012843 [Argiope bruennichi]|uniref:EB domain-containing protein n=1 Tax=Argiope bruennichi TaxID=94029 RepID=A0A8T0EYB2_ARGBR|nr:hypothetical protein HNY73_012843 [Argiope bruennichi]